MSIQRPSCFFNLCSSCSSRSNKPGGTSCSLLPAAGHATAQASPPHRTPIAGLAIPPLTHTCCYSPATGDELVNPRTVVLPSVWETTAESSLPPCRSLPRPRRRPLPWCSRRGVVNDVHPTAVVLLQPLVFLLQPPKSAPVVPRAAASRDRKSVV